MYYVIRVTVDGRIKYVFDRRLFVEDISFARKFYSLTYAKRYIRTHPLCQQYEPEIILPENDMISVSP